MSSTPSDFNRGTYYEACAWTFSALATIAVAVRLYTRCFLTRTAGLDDILIVSALCTTVTGNVGDTIAVKHGFGRHEQFLTSQQISMATKWTYIDLILNFVCLFLLRTSIMVFVLRLLPRTQRWPFHVIYAALGLNLAVSIFATVTYGIKCVPFSRIWDMDKPGHCLSASVAATTLIVNAALACLTDFITALVPIFLLYGVRMKKMTKTVLYIIFIAGLATAACSVGRAAETSASKLSTDITWRFIPTLMFGLFEEKFGIVVACAPAARQLFVKIKREGRGALRSTLPTTTKHPTSTMNSSNGGTSILRGLRPVNSRKSQDTINGHHRHLISAKPSTLRSSEDPEAQKTGISMQDWNNTTFIDSGDLLASKAHGERRESRREEYESTLDHSSEISVQVPDVTSGGDATLKKTEGPPTSEQGPLEGHTAPSKSESKSRSRSRTGKRNLPEKINTNARYTIMDPKLVPGSPMTPVSKNGAGR